VVQSSLVQCSAVQCSAVQSKSSPVQSSPVQSSPIASAQPTNQAQLQLQSQSVPPSFGKQWLSGTAWEGNQPRSPRMMQWPRSLLVADTPWRPVFDPRAERYSASLEHVVRGRARAMLVRDVLSKTPRVSSSKIALFEGPLRSQRAFTNGRVFGAKPGQER